MFWSEHDSWLLSLNFRNSALAILILGRRKLARIPGLVWNLSVQTDHPRQLFLRTGSEITVLGACAQSEAEVDGHQEGHAKHGEHGPLSEC
jgi:hypothetical protein